MFLKVEPKSLTDTRLQLHWASQLLSAAADAKVAKADDDSHSNLGWNESTNQLEGRADVSLDVSKFAIVHNDNSFSLTDSTLADGLKWLSESLQSEIKLRDYDMPEHAVSSGSKFNPNPEHLSVVADWYTFAQKTLNSQGELRVWPHHFDLGFWKPGAIEGKSIGGGFSPGDNYYDQPYFYINPYGVEKPDTLSELAHGQWTDHWFGAVLTAEEIQQGEPDAIATKFTNQAIELCHSLLNG